MPYKEFGPMHHLSKCVDHLRDARLYDDFDNLDREIQPWERATDPRIEENEPLWRVSNALDDLVECQDALDQAKTEWFWARQCAVTLEG